MKKIIEVKKPILERESREYDKLEQVLNEVMTYLSNSGRLISSTDLQMAGKNIGKILNDVIHSWMGQELSAKFLNQNIIKTLKMF